MTKQAGLIVKIDVYLSSYQHRNELYLGTINIILISNQNNINPRRLTTFLVTKKDNIYIFAISNTLL